MTEDQILQASLKELIDYYHTNYATEEQHGRWEYATDWDIAMWARDKAVEKKNYLKFRLACKKVYEKYLLQRTYEYEIKDIGLIQEASLFFQTHAQPIHWLRAALLALGRKE